MTIEIMNIKTAGHPSKPYDFYVDRRTPLGNLYPLKGESYRDEVCDAYDKYFKMLVSTKAQKATDYLDMIRRALEIYGKVRLFCWCAPKRCHAETIKSWLENNC